MNRIERSTFVVATDFSENADRALAWAKDLAARHRARVVVVHAFTVEALAAPEFVALPPQYYEQVAREARERVEHIADTLREAGLEACAEAVAGRPVASVLDVAQRERADLIVAGTHGRTGWRRAVLGSTAALLVRRAPCPVLTVHLHDAPPSLAVRTVLVPTDFSDDAALAARTAARLLCLPGDGHRLALLHAYRVPVDAVHLPAEVVRGAIREAADKARASLDEFAASLRRSGSAVDGISREGYPPDVVLAYAREVGADVIAMGTHGRSGFERALLGSTAESVVATAPCPVLTVRLARSE